ncbi:HNH endonuclease [Streptomyces xanthophaeus]
MSVPTKWQIAQHWNDRPDREVFAPLLETLDHACCFACGWYSERWAKASARATWERATLERAHIVPSSLGGDDDATNIILLCSPCHRDSPDWHEPSAMAAWIGQRPDRSSKEVEDMSDWCMAFLQVPEFRDVLAGLEAEPGLADEVAIERIVAMLWESTLKAGIHAGELSNGTKVAIMRDTASRVAAST